MSIADDVIFCYGTEIAVGDISSKGIVFPKAPENAHIVHRPLAPGVANDESYMLIAATETLPEAKVGAKLCAGGLEYEILRFEPIMLGTELSHWEAVMRLRGAEPYV